MSSIFGDILVAVEDRLVDYPESKTLDLNFAENQSLTADVGPTPSFSRASAGWYLNASGVLTEAAINAPSFDYVYNGTTWECRGLLIEAQKTNNRTYSQDLTVNTAGNWNLRKSITTLGGYASPDGGTNAQLVHPSANDAGGCWVGQNKSSSAGQYTASIYAKSAGKQWMWIPDISGNNPNWFDIQNGVTGNVASGCTTTITPIGNGWYRCTVTYTTGSSNNFLYIGISDANGSFGVTASGTDGVYVFGAQIESGATVTSYIKTDVGSATRSADVCQITGASFSGFYNASQGSFAVEYDSYGYSSGSLATTVTALLDGNNFMRHSIWGAGQNSRLNVFTSSVGQATFLFSASDAKIPAIAAFRYKLNDFAMSHEGAAVQTDTAGTPPSATSLHIGSFDGSSEYVNGHIARLRYYNVTLTDDELEDLSGSQPVTYIRKKPILLPEDDVPCLIISPGRERITDESFEKVVEYEYEVQISHIRHGDREYGRDDTLNLLELRQRIRNKLYQVLLPGAQSIDVKMELNPPFDVASGKASNYDISGYIMKYKVKETRVS